MSTEPKLDPAKRYWIDPERQKAAEEGGVYSFGVAPETGCGGCRFWKAGHTNVGACHRRAPTIASQKFYVAETYGNPVDWSHKDWPVTYSNDWCGDWEARNVSRET
jgi:hypothetical protein